MRERSSGQGYLQLMGVQAYVRRTVTDSELATDDGERPESESVAQAIDPLTETDTYQPAQAPATASVEPDAATTVSDTDDAQDLAAYMAWESMESAQATVLDDSPCAGTLDDVACLDWQALQQRVIECQACGLHKSRKQTVFGIGNPHADVMIIGEAPGADEDAKGEPFVGRAGKLLDAMLQAIGLSRQQVFIANILKCRPPANRNPSVEEVTSCEPYLLRQIELIQPKLILSVGGVSAHNLLKTDEKVGLLRQHWQKLAWRDIPVQVTYHPAYLLRQPAHKARAWEDLLKLKKAMQEANIT